MTTAPGRSRHRVVIASSTAPQRLWAWHENVATCSTRAAHTQQLHSTRNIPAKSKLPRIISSGIQPTGIPTYGVLLLCPCHVDHGIHFGALANWVKLQSTA